MLLLQGYVACWNFTLKTEPYLKQDITTLNTVHAEYSRTSITQIPC